MKRSDGWPSSQDVTGVIISLCRALSTYQLSVKDFSRGIIGDRESKARLTVQELEFIAKNRLFSGVPLRPWSGPEYALAIEFLEVQHQ